MSDEGMIHAYQCVMAERDRLAEALREIQDAGGYGATQQIAADALAEVFPSFDPNRPGNSGQMEK